MKVTIEKIGDYFAPKKLVKVFLFGIKIFQYKIAYPNQTGY